MIRKPLSTKNRRTPSPPRPMSFASAKIFEVVGLKWLTRTASTAKARRASSCTMCSSGVEATQINPDFFLRAGNKRSIASISLRIDLYTATAESSNVLVISKSR